MPKRERTPLHVIHGESNARFTVGAWDAANVAVLEASGSDVRSALEAGLRAVLQLSTAGGSGSPASDRSVPLRAEGDDLAELYFDLIDDFLDEMGFSAFACHDVAVDGVLHRSGGGYVAWGYALEATAPASKASLPRVLRMPTVESQTDGIVFRVAMVRVAA
jgi:hypothetical protein